MPGAAMRFLTCVGIWFRGIPDAAKRAPSRTAFSMLVPTKNANPTSVKPPTKIRIIGKRSVISTRACPLDLGFDPHFMTFSYFLLYNRRTNSIASLVLHCCIPRKGNGRKPDKTHEVETERAGCADCHKWGVARGS